jgi:PKD repeat protein
MSQRLKALPILLVLAAAAAAVPAQAYEYPQCLGYSKRWDAASITMYPSAIQFGNGWGYSQFKAPLEEARQAWNYSPAYGFPISFFYNNSSIGAVNDGLNSIAIRNLSTGWGYDPDFLATTIVRYDACTLFVEYGSILEADIFFNFTGSMSSAWNTVLEPSPSDVEGSYNFAIVAMHELGHAMGLDHENDLLATMNSEYPFGGPIGRDMLEPHADDVKGIRAGYGSSGIINDLAAVPYKSDGSGDSSPLASPSSTVYRSRSYTFPFTIENRGTTSFSSVTVGFYLTPDRVVTANETYLGSATFSLGVGATTTANATVTIPTSVTPGTYYFGWIVDPSETVSEGDRVNNGTTYMSAFTVPTAIPPTACFTASPTSGSASLEVTYNASCSSDPNGSIVSYSWDFDDGTTDTGVSGTHWYDWGGFYSMTLTVTDSDGLTDSDSVLIQVTDSESCPDPTQIDCGM